MYKGYNSNTPKRKKMENLLVRAADQNTITFNKDPVKIIIVGGCNCGKTTLLKRLTAFAVPFTDSYEATRGLNIARLSIQLTNGAVCNISIIDVGGELMERHDTELMNKIVENIEGVFIVVDATNVQSMKDSDNWLDLLSKVNGNINKFLLVNKSDLPIEQRVVTPQNLDTFMSYTDIVDWSYTVGHCQLVDLDASRGNMSKQKAPEGILRRMLTGVLQRRQSNFYKLLTPPMNLKFVSWLEIEAQDLETLKRMDIV
jgi:small GTP-binding protein